MDLLLFKLTITPIAVGLATLLARRFGPSFGGWLVGIPFTSAPVVVFLALDHGSGFATAAATGILAGTASQAAFALAYAWAAVRLGWAPSLAAGCAAFAVATLGLNTLLLTAVPALLIAAGAVAFALAMLPALPASVPEPRAPQVRAATDVVVRAALATSLVVLVTAIAPRIGATLAGLVSPFPLFGALFIVYPHRRAGSAAAIVAGRGLLFGLFAATAFFALVAQLLPTAGLAVTYVVAAAVAIGVQAATLAVLRRVPARTRTSRAA